MIENKKKIVIGILVVFVLIAGYFGAKAYIENAMEKKVDKAIGKVAYFIDVDYDKVKVDLMGLIFHIKGINISLPGKKGKAKIDDFIIYDMDKKNKFPLYLHIGLKGMNMGIENFGDRAEILKELGYQNIKANMELDYKYDDNNKEIYLNTLSSGAEDMGNINLKFHLSNIDLDSKHIAATLLTFSEVLLHNAELIYKDDSLVSRLIESAAKKQGKDVDDFIGIISEGIDNEISQEKDKFAKEAFESFKKFVKNPDKISISISPKKPVPVGRLKRLKDPKEIIKFLNAKVHI
jgi:hypothetical protein